MPCGEHLLELVSYPDHTPSRGETVWSRGPRNKATLLLFVRIATAKSFFDLATSSHLWGCIVKPNGIFN